MHAFLFPFLGGREGKDFDRDRCGRLRRALPSMRLFQSVWPPDLYLSVCLGVCTSVLYACMELSVSWKALFIFLKRRKVSRERAGA